jgi:hypothetical protein
MAVLVGPQCAAATTPDRVGAVPQRAAHPARSASACASSPCSSPCGCCSSVGMRQPFRRVGACIGGGWRTSCSAPPYSSAWRRATVEVVQLPHRCATKFGSTCTTFNHLYTSIRMFFKHHTGDVLAPHITNFSFIFRVFYYCHGGKRCIHTRTRKNCFYAFYFHMFGLTFI